MQQASDCAGGDNEGTRSAILLDFAQTLCRKLQRQDFPGWRIDRVSRADQARKLLHSPGYSVGLACLSGLSPLQLTQLIEIIRSASKTLWIALIEPPDRDSKTLQQLIGSCFYDYFTLPLRDSLSYLRATMGHALGIARYRNTTSLNNHCEVNNKLIGESKAIDLVMNQIEKVAITDAPVMISGATGTGKEMVARNIHQLSERNSSPFVAVNCGALPDTLIHAELFGYEKGAFTGAYRRKIGRIEAAGNGTIFLDEIGDLPLDLQVYLLRFLEQRTIERLGGTDSLQVDARVIAATHIDLETAVEQGRFREDLYYRLNVLKIHMPTLTERFEDIELLAAHFLQAFSQEHSIPNRHFSQDALSAMLEHSWPGNIRELINRIRSALIMGETSQISAIDLGLESPGPTPMPLTLEEARNRAEKMAIKSNLLFSGHNITQTARALGISRVTLYRLIDKYDLRRSDQQN